jgi:hypothetical protein
MIVVITTPNARRSMLSLAEGQFGFPTPRLVMDGYDALLRKSRIPEATYVFADLERLAPKELRLAAKLFRLLTEQGLRCLNNPARVMSRVELLQSLHAARINPFSVTRADEYQRQRLPRFPVFLRYEDNHDRPISGLLGDRDELEARLRRLRRRGIPLRGVLIVEYYGEPYAEGLWAKWGTFKIGSMISVDHIAVDDKWLVKRGVWDKLTDAAIADEHQAVKTNSFAKTLEPAFKIARIDWGRADHAVVGGQSVIYEINTSPYIGPYVPDPKELRRSTQELARKRIALSLEEIDTKSTRTVRLPAPMIQEQRRIWAVRWFQTLAPRNRRI